MTRSLACGMVAAALLLHVTLAFPPRALSPLTLRIAAAEAAAIWAPYGVAVDAVMACGCADDRPPVLTVAIAHSSIPAADPRRHGPLATIGFDAEGSPLTALQLYLPDIERMLAAGGVFGRDDARWPTALHDLVLGRVVGRVIAHEIGHYVLRMRGHAESGLMRAVHRTDLLIAPSRHGFGLSRDDLLRLRQNGPADAPAQGDER